MILSDIEGLLTAQFVGSGLVDYATPTTNDHEDRVHI